MDFLCGFIFRYFSVGPVFGIVLCFIVAMVHCMWCFWDWMLPAKLIEKCPDIMIAESMAGSGRITVEKRRNNGSS